jgi:hypothetical protein
MAVPFAEMQQLVGTAFPGGRFTIERWENFLLHDVSAATSPAGELAHPIYAFHAPLAAMGWSYAEFFSLCRAESDEAIRAGTYDFEYRKPLQQGATYTIRGRITDVERKRGGRAGLFDIVTFRLEMLDEKDEIAVVAINSWLFLRSEEEPQDQKQSLRSEDEPRDHKQSLRSEDEPQNPEHSSRSE